MSHSMRPHHMLHTHPHRQSTPTLPHLRSVFFHFSLLFILLCVAPLCSSLPFFSTAVRPPSSSSSTAVPDVWSPTPTSATAPADVWPDTSTADEYRPVPDTTSTLRCLTLELTPLLQYNQTMLCTIECKTMMAATVGRFSDYEWSADAFNGGTGSSHSTIHRLPTKGDVKFGSVSNFTLQNDSKVIAFVYTAPNTGTEGVLHVMATRGAEIQNSPIMFKLSPPHNASNSTTPVVVPPPDTTSSTSFASLSNPVFIAVCSAGVVLLVAVVLIGVWARRVFARKAEELRERQASEARWAHSVPSLKARLDLPHPSTLRSPLLQ